jgi:ribosome-associated translation inhibitor RaiA
MQIDIQSQGFPLTPSLRGHVHRRLVFSLGRVIPGVRRLSVRLSDVNGPRGGKDKQCMIEIGLPGRRTVLVAETGQDMYTAIGEAARRAGRAVMRRMRQLRQFRHERLDSGVEDDGGDTAVVSAETGRRALRAPIAP